MVVKYLHQPLALAAKCFISGLILLFFFGLLLMSRAWIRPAGSAPVEFCNSTSNPQQALQAPIHPSQHSWPKFPLQRFPASRDIEIAGVKCQVETWQTPVEGWEVIDFYKRMMASQGWQDVTEEAYHLTPGQSVVGDQLHMPAFLQRYRTIVDSTLVLTRDGQTLQVFASPSPRSAFETMVGIVLAQCDSTADFAATLQNALEEPNGGLRSKEINFSENYGRTGYRSSILRSTDDPATAHAKAITLLQSEGWREALPKPQMDIPGKVVSHLTRGRETALVMTTPDRSELGAAVMITRVVDQE